MFCDQVLHLRRKISTSMDSLVPPLNCPLITWLEWWLLSTYASLLSSLDFVALSFTCLKEEEEGKNKNNLSSAAMSSTTVLASLCYCSLSLSSSSHSMKVALLISSRPPSRASPKIPPSSHLRRFFSAFHLPRPPLWDGLKPLARPLSFGNFARKSCGNKGVKPLFVIPHEKVREDVEEVVGDDTHILFITTPGQLAALVDDAIRVIATNTAALQLANARNKPRCVKDNYGITSNIS
ncbi:hypothetical protein ZIOFF_029073 [Zingiber officinale]|uniref:Uncharacterized protein n=1 Tax=Zingiber officinale TaxID=94328 RepID=A0A8J5H0V6_ZINOF|nr:hypothetical protein ZIOFF_029073 [Zingiber officinale]